MMATRSLICYTVVGQLWKPPILRNVDLSVALIANKILFHVIHSPTYHSSTTPLLLLLNFTCGIGVATGENSRKKGTGASDLEQELYVCFLWRKLNLISKRRPTASIWNIGSNQLQMLRNKKGVSRYREKVLAMGSVSREKTGEERWPTTNLYNLNRFKSHPSFINVSNNSFRLAVQVMLLRIN